MDAIGPFLYRQARNSSWLCAKTTKNCRWKRPPRTAGAACRVTTFGGRCAGNAGRTKTGIHCRRPRPARLRSCRAAPKRRRATSPTRTANQALPPTSTWLAWLTPLCPAQSSTAQLDVVVRPENSSRQANTKKQRQKLCSVHNFQRCLWWP